MCGVHYTTLQQRAIWALRETTNDALLKAGVIYKVRVIFSGRIESSVLCSVSSMTYLYHWM